MELVERMLQGEKKALARLMTIVENNEQKAAGIIASIYPHIGNAHVIGITGPPGAGKSTLVDSLASRFRELGKSVGVLAVDPTSPFTGGSILGDRIRMQNRSFDDEIFIRSLATRGSLGGLSRATGDFVKLMDAFGKDVILIETVGTGQSEVEIVSLAHTTMVVLNPGGGDEVQTIKAGIMEIGDLFVINKADYPEADRTVHEIEAMLFFKKKAEEDWNPPVLKAVAREQVGIPAIVDQLNEHFSFLQQSKRHVRKEHERVDKELGQLLRYRIEQEIEKRIKQDGTYLSLLDQVRTRQMDPYTAIDHILRAYQPSEKSC